MKVVYVDDENGDVHKLQGGEDYRMEIDDFGRLLIYTGVIKTDIKCGWKLISIYNCGQWKSVYILDD